MDGRRCSSAGQIIDPNHFPTKIKAAFIAAFSFVNNIESHSKENGRKSIDIFPTVFLNDLRSKTSICRRHMDGLSVL